MSPVSPAPNADRSQVIRSVAVGTACFAVGAVGLIIPIIPGIPLLVAGVVAFAGVIGPLRRFISTVLQAPPTTKSIEAVTKSRHMRRGMAMALQTPMFRQGLTATCRQHILRLMLKRATKAPEPDRDKLLLDAPEWAVPVRGVVGDVNGDAAWRGLVPSYRALVR